MSIQTTQSAQPAQSAQPNVPAQPDPLESLWDLMKQSEPVSADNTTLVYVMPIDATSAGKRLEELARYPENARQFDLVKELQHALLNHGTRETIQKCLAEVCPHFLSLCVEDDELLADLLATNPRARLT